MGGGPCSLTDDVPGRCRPGFNLEPLANLVERVPAVEAIGELGLG